MATDRSVRFLHALGGASTGRVLNLGQIARKNHDNPDHAARPLFRSPAINTAFIVKHRVRSDEAYLFSSPRSVATKIIVPFDREDLRAGGHSLFIDQRGFREGLRTAGNYSGEALERDMGVLQLMNAIPSLDPFLLREHLNNNQIDVAPCYFEISEGDQKRMHQFVSHELSRLVQLASGGRSGASTARMVAAMLSSQVDEKLEPLRQTLDLTGEDFREGVFSWRGFLYYKWTMSRLWPDLIAVLREVKTVWPHGALTAEQRVFLTGAKRGIIEMVRDNGRSITDVLSVYDNSYNDMVTRETPRTFRDFLLSAPHMFLELGEKVGVIAHIASFWRYRFPPGSPVFVDVEELSAIFQDFISSFADRHRHETPFDMEGLRAS